MSVILQTLTTHQITMISNEHDTQISPVSIRMAEWTYDFRLKYTVLTQLESYIRTAAAIHWIAAAAVFFC